MNTEQQVSWRRYTAFGAMNAHSQADDPTLMYVTQFNSDERVFQERRRRKQLALGSGEAGHPAENAASPQSRCSK